MKKLVAMVLALCLLMACVPAFATLTLPETAADVPGGSAKPEAPAFTFEEKEDHYEVTVEGTDEYTSVRIEGYTETGEAWYGIFLSYDPETGKFVSDGLMMEEYNHELQLFIERGNSDGGYSNVWMDLEGNPVSVCKYVPGENSDTWYYWHEDGGFNYEHYESDGSSWEGIDVYYAANGKINYYTVSKDNLSLHYNKYGAVTEAYYWDEDGDYYWDRAAGQWVDYEGNPCPDLDLPAATADNYPAPYAVPFVLNRPAAKLEDVDLSEGELLELDDGNTIFLMDYVSAFYDEDGNLYEYGYTDKEENKFVQYDVNDVLLFARVDVGNGCSYVYDAELGWFYDNGDEWIEIDESDLPEGVNVDDMKPLKDPAPTASKVQYTWYDHNTVGLVGLSLRDMGITDKWYNVVPVDLTQDGVQVLDLVGSNLFHIGKAAVIVQDGKVSVDYDLFFGEGYVKDECVQWFTSLDDITTDFLNNPTSDVAFGQELSIADDLGGAETAILFICNHVTYRQPYNGDNGYLSRYWPNRQRWIDYRAELTELLEGMSK